MLTDEQIKQTATNRRKLASDPKMKKMFTSATRKSFNDDANAIMAALTGNETKELHEHITPDGLRYAHSHREPHVDDQGN